MSNFLRGKLNDNRLGLALAAFFGWLLSFPMYGRFLLETAGESAPYLGLVFITSQGAGLMILHLLPSRLAANHRIIRSAGIAVAALTVLYAFAQRTMIIDTLIMIVFAFASAYLELAWVTFFAGQTKPLQTLVIAMAGANLVCAAISIPLPLPEELYLTLLAVLAASSVFLFPARNSETTTEGCPLPDSREALKTIAVLAVFVVAVYLIGGIWYDIFALEITASPLMQASTGFLIYSAGIICMACLARCGQPGNLAIYSLSALGIGLLIALSGSGKTIVFLFYQVALNLGLAAADLFFWYALWVLARYYETRRVFGLGLGFSVIVIALSIVICNLGVTDSLPALFYITALTLLFLLVPLIFQYPFNLLNRPASAGKASGRTTILTPPDILTPTESKVYTMLLQGADDSAIAEQMVISKHTVKFHVRNTLRKMEVKNRKELLSRSLNQK